MLILLLQFVVFFLHLVIVIGELGHALLEFTNVLLFMQVLELNEISQPSDLL